MHALAHIALVSLAGIAGGWLAGAAWGESPTPTAVGRGDGTAVRRPDDSADEAAADVLIEQLRSDDPRVRHQAVERLAKLPAAPAAVVPALVAAARRELDSALGPVPPSDLGLPGGRVPLEGDEVSLERIEANAPDYIDQRFVLVGAVSLSDHYFYGYWRAEATHYALAFTPLAADGGRAGSQRAMLYLSRWRGRPLEEQIVRLAEEGVDRAVVRVRATIVGYRHKTPESWKYMELLDWQLLNPQTGTWGAWAYAGFDRCFDAVRRAGDGAVAPLVDVIADPQASGHAGDVMNDAAVRSLTELVTGHAVELSRVSRAIHEAQEATAEPQVRRRLALALASIEEALRNQPVGRNSFRQTTRRTEFVPAPEKHR